MAALFGSSASDGRREPRSLVEFRAGKMTLSGTTVTADPRKGLVYMKLDDGLVHFYWKDRKTGSVGDDLIIFPGDAEFKRVSQCTTGRVFILKFKDSARKYFYWMQEPSEDKDEDLIKKVNDIIEHPPDPSSVAAEGLAGLSGLSGLPPGLMNNPQLIEQLISSGAIPPDLLRLDALGGRGASSSSSPRSTTAAATDGPPSSSSARQQSSSSRRQQPVQQQETRPPPTTQSQIQLSDLQSILSSITIPEGGQGAPEDHVSLNEAITPDVLRPLSNNSAVQEQVSDHLPPTSEGVPTILNSPQFHQAMGLFSSALQSGQLGPLMGQFGLGPGVAEAANTGSVQRFAAALQTELSDAEDSKDKEDKEASSKDKDNKDNETK
ncbi:proteasomal ubiquitin receptor ADRM1-like isoform X2 [Halichondria panicea]